ncbi:hypothetical protein PBI_BUTTERS_36 [Mycobacterium phage Butters]|uniref:DUF2510 domain-containing protein n=3 Tax=Charlievirus TaxID=1623280 RepID=A0A2Z5HG18_9CAUD|nr:hypothetical protein K768_gp36 [Mycobacterium phage Butters]YP_010052037.1 hypothetical protein KD930_gp34 [Mycobacterium phage Kevin1]AGI12983.1 hypothetical protein PBI_BUTTERS_36 [Mycobacterium phage Butters]AXC38498.1 hypothetical protein SEA_RUBEELU_36 [Mycobacterium phage Rubeelu]QBI97278.1 hypothetical protein SEA_KEVIN1_34 [Mycobacterium phage Kevin1]
MTEVPPGWYPDPEGGGQRYWDGRQWTSHRAPLPPPAPAAERRFTVNYGFALLAIFSLLGTLLFGVPLIANGAEMMGTMWLFWGGMWTLIWGAFAVQHTLRNRR